MVDAHNKKVASMARLQKERIMYKNPNCPPWVQASLELAERIESRRGSH
jgi:hypothetical protein